MRALVERLSSSLEYKLSEAGTLTLLVTLYLLNPEHSASHTVYVQRKTFAAEVIIAPHGNSNG